MRRSAARKLDPVVHIAIDTRMGYRGLVAFKHDMVWWDGKVNVGRFRVLRAHGCSTTGGGLSGRILEAERRE